MGNSSPPAQGDRVDHERLGAVTLEMIPRNPLEDEEDDSYLMHFTKTVESQKAYNEWAKGMETVQDSETEEVLLLPRKHEFQSVGLCGAGGLAKLTYDYYEFVLETEIANRRNLKKDFVETEIWYLLYNMVRAETKFQNLRRKVGNIHPRNILINESGQIKIISTCSIPGESNNYDRLLQAQGENAVVGYLAPEQINHDLIHRGAYPSHVDPNLAEVFSIGVTILSSGTLINTDELYRISPYELKKELLHQHMQIFRQKYSDYLFQTVASMLELNPQHRRKASAISASLIEYEAQILDLEPFPMPQGQARGQPQRASQVRVGQNPPVYQPNPQPYHGGYVSQNPPPMVYHQPYQPQQGHQQVYRPPQ